MEIYTTIGKLFKQYNRENSIELLKEIIDWYIDEKEYSDFTEEENKCIQIVGDKYYVFLDSMVGVLARKNYKKEEFYDQLYRAVFESDWFPTDEKERGVLLFFMTRRIDLLPYFEAKDVVDISQRDFTEIVDKIEDKLDEARFMTSGRFFMQRNEAVQLSRICNELETDKERAVFWMVVLSMIRKSGKDD